MRGRAFVGLLGLMGCALVAAGCGDHSAARYVPPAPTARQALETALRAWQEGQAPGKVAGQAHPEVILVDNCRVPEQKLERFTILGETAGDGPRCFAVRVRLQNPNEEHRLRFVVFGVDPLWVYRYEDYEMMIHWQCGTTEKNKRLTTDDTANTDKK